jgi:hypothetical protein
MLTLGCLNVPVAEVSPGLRNAHVRVNLSITKKIGDLESHNENVLKVYITVRT